MMNAAKGVAAESRHIIADNAWAYPGYNLVIIGHSLGGAVAAFLGLLWYSDPMIRKLDMKIYSLAPPAVWESVFNKYMSPIILSLIYGTDMICRVVPPNMRELFRTAREWKELDEHRAEYSSNEILKMTLNAIPRDV